MPCWNTSAFLRYGRRLIGVVELDVFWFVFWIAPAFSHALPNSCQKFVAANHLFLILVRLLTVLSGFVVLHTIVHSSSATSATKGKAAIRSIPRPRRGGERRRLRQA